MNGKEGVKMHNNLLNYYEVFGREKPETLVEDIETLTNLDWRKMRQKGIGGSDAGTILLGGSTFKTPFDIARSKLDELFDESIDQNDQYRLDFGHAMEPVILEWYAREKHCEVFTDRGMYFSSKHPVMLADCDGFAITESGELIGLEIKTTSLYNMKKWKSGEYGVDGEIGVESYYVQVQHYMEVMDIDRFDIVCAFGNNAYDIRVVTVPRDSKYGQQLAQKEEAFWANLNDIGSQMPVSTSAKNASSNVDYLRKMGVKIDDKDAEEKCQSILDKKLRISSLKAEIDNLEKSVEADKILLLGSINDNEKTQFGRFMVINKVTTSYRYDTKEMKKHPELDIYKKEVTTKKFDITERD